MKKVIVSLLLITILSCVQGKPEALERLPDNVKVIKIIDDGWGFLWAIIEFPEIPNKQFLYGYNVGRMCITEISKD